MEINKIALTGYAKSKPEYSFTSKRGMRYYIFDLIVLRRSGIEDIIPVLLREDNIVPIKEGDCVSLVGSLTTRNWHNRLSVKVLPKVITVTGPINCINNVELDGYIARTPYVKEIPELQKTIADFLIAVNQGNKADYIPVIVWNKLARMASDLECGNHVHITGRIQSREYIKKNEDGSIFENVAYEVSGNKMEICKEVER